MYSWCECVLCEKKKNKETCGHHNIVTTGNLCKAVVYWNTQTVHNEPTASAWECQMRNKLNSQVEYKHSHFGSSLFEFKPV